jgi:hypothetical protein
MVACSACHAGRGETFVFKGSERMQQEKVDEGRTPARPAGTLICARYVFERKESISKKYKQMGGIRRHLPPY